MSAPFYILDFDFTLFKTHLGSDMLIEELTQYDADAARMVRKNVDEHIARGASFAIRDEIAGLIGEEATSHIETRFIEAAKDIDMLFGGARELMDYITASGSRYAILTYGSPTGQAMKIKAAGLADVPFMVTDQAHKGALVAGFADGDGHFVLPEALGGGVVDEIVLVDDRLFSFDGLPVHTLGYWVQTGPVQYDPLSDAPANVRPIPALHDVVAAEQARRASTD